MRGPVTAFAAGGLFAIGLGLSGMTRPEKVVGFLDVLGSWDPSLMVVMMSAVATHMLLWRWGTSGDSPWFGDRFRVPTRTDIDPRLVAGSALFGAGWGLGGYCPGPAVASLSSGTESVLVFSVSMVAGMTLWRAVHRSWESYTASQVEPAAAPAGVTQEV